LRSATSKFCSPRARAKTKKNLRSRIGDEKKEKSPTAHETERKTKNPDSFPTLIVLEMGEKRRQKEKVRAGEGDSAKKRQSLKATLDMDACLKKKQGGLSAKSQQMEKTEPERAVEKTRLPKTGGAGFFRNGIEEKVEVERGCGGRGGFN